MNAHVHLLYTSQARRNSGIEYLHASAWTSGTVCLQMLREKAVGCSSTKARPEESYDGTRRGWVFPRVDRAVLIDRCGDNGIGATVHEKGGDCTGNFHRIASENCAR